jgi:hypothetical protein
MRNTYAEILPEYSIISVPFPVAFPPFSLVALLYSLFSFPFSPPFSLVFLIVSLIFFVFPLNFQLLIFSQNYSKQK